MVLGSALLALSKASSEDGGVKLAHNGTNAMGEPNTGTLLRIIRQEGGQINTKK